MSLSLVFLGFYRKGYKEGYNKDYEFGKTYGYSQGERKGFDAGISAGELNTLYTMAIKGCDGTYQVLCDGNIYHYANHKIKGYPF
ncbi:MAG: hypothetical protein LBG19_03170 [Prevotellaceae bacterium]|nr:hypothetical protein [Prevotellaceae bacterium]